VDFVARTTMFDEEDEEWDDDVAYGLHNVHLGM
jgi:hypothetical protein